LADAIRERDRYREALDLIASWREGETVTNAFDEPGAAIVAREALAIPPPQEQP
jgi:hypothetical protein